MKTCCPPPRKKPGRDQWLRLELVPDGPLSGQRKETRTLRLWTDHTGVRSAVLNFNAGQGTQDPGFRSDVLPKFKIKPAPSIKEAARREALAWFRLFTRLPYEVPCELQAEMLELSLEVYRVWIVQAEADPQKTAAWLEKLRDLGKHTRAILGATRVEWRGDSLAVPEAAPIALTAGLKRAVLLEVTYRTAEPALLVPVWSGWKGAVADGIDLQPGETREITLGSQRFLDMKPLGWISGDTHIHWAKNWWSEDEDIQLLKMVQRAEDLRVANNLTLKHHTTDQNFIALTQYPMGPIPGLCDDDYHAQMAEEYRNEEFYGHIIFLNIKRLIQPISTGFMGGPPFWDWPLNLPAIKEARAQGGISIEAHGLGRNNDVPVNVAQGFSDSLDQLEPHDYYCFREPLSIGSDHPARGADVCRVYVKTEMPFSYERWIDGFRKNSTFTTSRPQ